MKTTVDRVEGRVPVTILRLDGDLDASNFEMVIDEGRRLYKEGARDLLLDLRSVPFMGSSGLVALHSLALIFNGKEPPDPESGWAAHHAFSQAVDSGLQPHIKILLPSAPDSALARIMQRTGFERFIDVHTDEAAAIAAFESSIQS